MLAELSLKTLNTLINKALTYADCEDAVTALQDKAIAIHIQGFEKTIYCLFQANQIELTTAFTGTANTQISGGPFSLLNILLCKNLNVEGVNIEGDIKTAQQMKLLADHLDIDWEALLADKIGASPAYHLGKFAKKLKTYAQHQRRDFHENLGNYLKDEKKLLVSPDALAEFYDQIDECRFQADRLTVRLKKLTQQVQGDTHD